MRLLMCRIRKDEVVHNHVLRCSTSGFAAVLIMFGLSLTVLLRCWLFS